MPHGGLEPQSVLRLAFQSDALPAELSPLRNDAVFTDTDSVKELSPLRNDAVFTDTDSVKESKDFCGIHKHKLSEESMRLFTPFRYINPLKEKKPREAFLFFSSFQNS